MNLKLAMEEYMHFVNEMLGQFYQDEKLRECIGNVVQINPKRIRILHRVVMNYDCMSREEIRDWAYAYGQMIEEEELAARQLLLCMMRLAEL